MLYNVFHVSAGVETVTSRLDNQADNDRVSEFQGGWKSLLGVVKEFVPLQGMRLRASIPHNLFPTIPASISHILLIMSQFNQGNMVCKLFTLLTPKLFLLRYIVTCKCWDVLFYFLSSLLFIFYQMFDQTLESKKSGSYGKPVGCK